MYIYIYRDLHISANKSRYTNAILYLHMYVFICLIKGYVRAPDYASCSMIIESGPPAGKIPYTSDHGMVMQI